MYETIVILNPNTTNEIVDSKLSDWTQLINDYGAKIQRTERWGKKNLAFEVKKFHQGIFLLFHIDGNHDCIAELERRFRIADEVIRFQTVKMTDMEYKTSCELLDSLNTRFSEEIAEENSEHEVNVKDEKDADASKEAALEIADESAEETQENQSAEENNPDESCDKETNDQEKTEAGY